MNKFCLSLSLCLASFSYAHAQVVRTETPEQNFAVKAPSREELTRRVEALEKRVREGGVPADGRNTALWRFKIEQARLLLDERYAPGAFASPFADDSRLIATLDAIDKIGAQTGEATVMPLDATWERAYIAADGSPQPYWIYLPENYDAGHKYPLVVVLHGYDPDITKANPWLPGALPMRAGTDRGFIVAVPYGRRNTDFLGVGEDDTLAVRSEMLKHYSIDEDRVFLLGASMGGYGVWAVGLKTPHLWAGLSAMAARSDTWRWLKLDPHEVAPWKLPLYQADDPRFLERNALNVPVFFQHGGADPIVPTEHSRLIYEDWKRLGYAARYREIPDGDHYIYWQASSYDMAFEWMQPLRRRKAPSRVIYTTASLNNNRSYWARIEAFENYALPATVDASVKGREITVSARNIARLVLNLPPFLARENMALRVNEGAPKTVDGRQSIVWTSAAVSAAPSAAPAPAGPTFAGARKSPARTGTIRDAYRGPLLLVYGNEADEAAAKRFAEEWRVYADGILPLKQAREVTVADKAGFNLVLFGTRETNETLAEISALAGDKLPLEKTGSGYRIGTRDKEVENPEEIGVIFCYPSPYDARREIVVHSGAAWGAALPVNHKFDLQPDYMVFTGEIEPQDHTNRALEAGFFDNAWQLTG